MLLLFITKLARNNKLPDTPPSKPILKTTQQDHLLCMMLVLSVLLQAFFMAYGAPQHTNQANRLDFLSSSICSQDLDKALSSQNHHSRNQEPQSKHDHCLQGCFLCAFCLTYRDIAANFSAHNLNGHHIIWLSVAQNTMALDYVSNQARAPPHFIKTMT